jgi:predicted Zn-dependent protease
MVFDGYFTDGQTARRRPVRIVCAANRLQIFDRQDALLKEWPFAGLRLAGEVYRRQPVRLSHHKHADACLVLANHQILEVLGRELPHFRRHRYRGDKTMLHILLWGAALVVVTVGLLKGVPLLAAPLAYLVPAQWEQAWGEQMLALLSEDTAACESGEGRAALQALTERLTATTTSPFPFDVRISSSPLVNALALPGGHIVLFQGLVTAAQSPEEVAGILAHEMAHEVQRHPMRGLLRAAGLRLVIGALTGGSGSALSLAGFGEFLLQLSYNREDETEADRLGVEMLNKANIRGDGLVAFFARQKQNEEKKSSAAATERETTSRAAQFLSTHPTDETRVTAIQARARGTENALTKKQWQALRTICEEGRE